MTKTFKRWTLMNAKTGKLVKSQSFFTRDEARFIKSVSSLPYKIFDNVTGTVVR